MCASPGTLRSGFFSFANKKPDRASTTGLLSARGADASAAMAANFTGPDSNPAIGLAVPYASLPPLRGHLGHHGDCHTKADQAECG
jgi:hypothetical protein